MSKNFPGGIHPKERRNYEKGCVAKQLRRIARREARKAARRALANG